MSYRIFCVENANQNDTAMVDQCTSAIFNYQVIGDGEVEFYGSNVPVDQLDPTNDNHWVHILTLSGGIADSEPFRQHCWNALRYKVKNGNVGIYVTSGVSG